MGLRDSLIRALESDSLSAPAREKIISDILHYNPALAESLVLSEDPALYSGLEESALSTPFFDYYQVLTDLGPHERLVDLGAGHCKGTLLGEAVGLEGKCLSLELSKDRSNNALDTLKKLGLASQSIRSFDIRQDPLPASQAYFIYLPLGPLIFRPIQTLLKRQEAARFYVVESHGDMLDFFNSMPKWFEHKKMLPSEGPRHKAGVHVYEFLPIKVEVSSFNGPEFIYHFVENYDELARIFLKKESGEVEVQMKDLLPLKYNGRPCFECLSLKRVVDYQNVIIMGP